MGNYFAVAKSILKDRQINHSRQNESKEFKCDQYPITCLSI